MNLIGRFNSFRLYTRASGCKASKAFPRSKEIIAITVLRLKLICMESVILLRCCVVKCCFRNSNWSELRKLLSSKC